jgi:glycosyltransferase involved in cell wall biosynthesis
MAALLPGQTTVVVRRKEPYLEDLGIRFPYLVLGERKLNWLWLYRAGLYLLKFNQLSPIQVRVEQYLRQYGVKIILSEFLNFSLKWLGVAHKLGVRFFAHAHGHDISAVLHDPGMQKRYGRLENADGIITMSEYSRKKLIGIGLSGDKIHVIPYGVEVPDISEIRPDDTYYIRCLSVGRMVAKKAPLLTLEAFRRALVKNPLLRLDFVGDGELLEEAMQFVNAHALNDTVVLHGSQPNTVVQDLMKKAQIFLQHSRTDPATGDEEGLPVAILEAMANGLPVISTRHAGIPEAVLEGVTGFLADEEDVEAMAVHIVQLADNYELRTHLGKSGWQRAKRHFSWENEKTELFKVLGLESIANKSNGMALGK